MYVQASINNHWPRIKSAVAEMCEGHSECAEDVYAMCKYGHGHLLISEDSFVILQEIIDICTGLKKLHIYMAWSFKNTGVNLIDIRLPELEEMGRKIGASKMTFQTMRKGFEKKLPEDWSFVGYLYEKTL